MKRGDLVVVAASGDFGKPRPAVIIQSDAFPASHASLIVCQLTSHLSDAPTFRVTFARTAANGLRENSQIMADKPVTVRRDWVGKSLGRFATSTCVASTPRWRSASAWRTEGALATDMASEDSHRIRGCRKSRRIAHRESTERERMNGALIEDDENPTWTRKDFARASGPEALSAAELAAFPRTAARLGRPKLATTKVAVKLRLDSDVIAAFKAGGPGWQTRMNAALRDAPG